MKTALLAGSFDPPTRGHEDLIKKALKVVDRLIIGVAINPAKKPLFSSEERLELLAKLFPEAHIVAIEGLLIDFAKANGVDFFLRGIRSLSDLEAERGRAMTNFKLGNIETVFIPTSPEFAHISGSLLKELAASHHSLEEFIPASLLKVVEKRLLAS